MNRILHISANTYPRLGEKEHHTKRIWQELATDVDEYHVFARSQNNAFSYSIEGNIHLHLIPKIHSKSRVFMLTSFFVLPLISKHKITHLTAQSSLLGGLTAVLMSKLYKLPLLTEIHGEEYFSYLRSNKLFSKLIKFSFSNSTKIRSLSSSMSNKLLYYGFQKNVVLIPNRVNLNLFKIHKNSFEVNGKINLISVGRFVWQKNYLELIKKLSNSNLNFHLTLIGGGVEKINFENFLLKNNLIERVTLIDWVTQKELAKIIINSDIYIQSSLSEGMPRTILEAMALKMPIISTNVGSIKGILNANNSILINCDLSELVSSILKIYENYEFRKSIAESAYKDVCEKYEWNKVFELFRHEIKTMKY